MRKLGKAGFLISILQADRFLHTVMHAGGLIAQGATSEDFARHNYIHAVVEDILKNVPERRAIDPSELYWSDLD